MTIRIYGIPNCDRVRAARGWLKDRGIAHTFHDYRKDGAEPAMLAGWAAKTGWEALLNTRGTTFRALTETDRRDLDEARALALMAAHPSLIRRPILDHAGGLLVGFDAEAWAAELT